MRLFRASAKYCPRYCYVKLGKVYLDIQASQEVKSLDGILGSLAKYFLFLLLAFLLLAVLFFIFFLEGGSVVEVLYNIEKENWQKSPLFLANLVIFLSLS